MTSIDHRAVSPEFPFASLLRSSDRERILVQLMTSVWETILQLPILPREGHDGDEVRSGDLPLVAGRIQIAGAWEGTFAMTGPRSFAAKCAASMHGREPQALTEAEVRDGWGELVNSAPRPAHRARARGLRVRGGGLPSAERCGLCLPSGSGCG
jgi:chemotaxis phosphatase CheX-like protein